MNRLKQYRERYGLTQPEAVAEIRRRAVARGDIAEPGLDRPALSKHENGHKRPGPYYRALYSEVYGATPAELGFRVALPSETRDHADVDRREFLAGASGFVASAALPALPEPTRLGSGDIARLRQSVIQLGKLDDLHGGAGSVYPLTLRTFDRLRGLVERASYDPTTGQALRELAGQTAAKAGWLAFDAGRNDDARRWWLEATHWSRLTDTDSIGVNAMASMAWEASDQGRPREAIDLATAAHRTAGRAATPRLTSILLAREAMGHAGAGHAERAHAALRRARRHAETRHDGDPSWIDFYGPANLALHEYHVALLLGDTAAAEDAARTALALNDPTAYPRNHAIYLVRLADVLVRRRQIDEGAAVAGRAAAAVADVDSQRATHGLRGVARSLEPFRDEPAVGEFLAGV